MDILESLLPTYFEEIGEESRRLDEEVKKSKEQVSAPRHWRILINTNSSFTTGGVRKELQAGKGCQRRAGIQAGQYGREGRHYQAQNMLHGLRSVQVCRGGARGETQDLEGA